MSLLYHKKENLANIACKIVFFCMMLPFVTPFFMKIENITLAYGNKNILKDANITINHGEFVFLIGGSGSGKTSFIKMLIGDLKPKS